MKYPTPMTPLVSYKTIGLVFLIGEALAFFIGLIVFPELGGLVGIIIIFVVIALLNGSV